MKMLMLAALAVATPAFAQTMPAPAPADPAMTQPMPTPPAPPADPAMTPPAPPMPMAAPMASDGPYPMCSRTVTDHCTERSNARGERKRSTPRPK